MKLQDRNLFAGLKGHDVKLLQIELSQLGFAIVPKERDEGVFGPSTDHAVRGFQKAKGLTETGTVGAETALEINRAVDALQPSPRTPDNGDEPQLDPKPDSGRFIVQGEIHQPDGGVTVRAFDRDLRSEELLGETTTDAKGQYEIAYSADRFSRSENDTADLFILVFNADGRELTRSENIFNAGSVETINVTIDGAEFRGPAEYERLIAELTPLLQGVAFTEGDQHQDITFLSKEGGEDQQRITFLIGAHRFATDTQVRPEIFYGLFREGLPTELPLFLASDPDLQRDALAHELGHTLGLDAAGNLDTAYYDLTSGPPNLMRDYRGIMTEHQSEVTYANGARYLGREHRSGESHYKTARRKLIRRKLEQRRQTSPRTVNLRST